MSPALIQDTQALLDIAARTPMIPGSLVYHRTGDVKVRLVDARYYGMVLSVCLALERYEYPMRSNLADISRFQAHPLVPKPTDLI
jgi:hypothetical protein